MGNNRTDHLTVRFAGSGEMCTVLATEGGAGSHFRGHKLQADSCFRGREIILHSPAARAGESFSKKLYCIFFNETFIKTRALMGVYYPGQLLFMLTHPNKSLNL